jgi:hypothetical protein
MRSVYEICRNGGSADVVSADVQGRKPVYVFATASSYNLLNHIQDPRQASTCLYAPSENRW